MPVISVTQPSDGTDADAADVNSQINSILAVANGYLDSDNIASLSGTKILAGTLPATAMDSTANQGWSSLAGSFTGATHNGNRSYTINTSANLTSVLTPGWRFRTTRATPAPSQCASLNGSNQYFSKSSPNGMTFTDDFTVSAWVRLTSYGTGDIVVVSRYNGTSGWWLAVRADGTLKLTGFNSSSSNFSQVSSVQGVPLNRWVHVAAQLDMSSFTATTSTSYIMMDGLNIPAVVGRGGTNPTALVQAGSLEVGSANSGNNLFPGKLAQVAVFSNKVAQSTVSSYVSQSLAGNEADLVSAYSLSNSTSDLNTSNANDLTAQNSASTTTADAPFGRMGGGTISTTLDYSIVTSVTSSTVTVQAAEGNTITSGGLSAAAASPARAPYGFPAPRERWQLVVYLPNSVSASTSASADTWYNAGNFLNLTTGTWMLGYSLLVDAVISSATFEYLECALSTSSSTPADPRLINISDYDNVAKTEATQNIHLNDIHASASALTPYYILLLSHRAATSLSISVKGNSALNYVTADLAYL